MFSREIEKEIEDGDGAHIVIEERNGLIEAYHRAHIAVVDSSGELLYSSGDPHHVTFTRSCIKPIQALPVLYTGAAEHYGFTDGEIAIMGGSHSGEPEHLETVRSILEKAALDEKMLKCGGHAPFNREQARMVGDHFTPLHDNCSGKHAGALAVCRFMGWDLDTYTEWEHPLTKEVISTISSLTDLPEREIILGTDGCGIPNFGIPIDRMARMFSLLVDPGDIPLSPHLFRMSRAMMEHPFLVAGTERFDTLLMNGFKGNIISKAGAVGLQTVAARTENGWVGISIKIADGAYGDIIPVLTRHILGELGFDDRSSHEKPVRTRSGEVVGRIRALGRLKKRQ